MPFVSSIALCVSRYCVLGCLAKNVLINLLAATNLSSKLQREILGFIDTKTIGIFEGSLVLIIVNNVLKRSNVISGEALSLSAISFSPH